MLYGLCLLPVVQYIRVAPFSSTIERLRIIVLCSTKYRLPATIDTIEYELTLIPLFRLKIF